ncbi:MAG: pyridoxamine 5'-phosphate oxidase family protein [Neomegalonema sp.]|nr:pyridoxamine 5'-phosphate oxidase family protein [Neomegalonema sp.]
MAQNPPLPTNTDQLPTTERSRLRRAHQRGAFDRKTINAILDATPLAHVAYVLDGAPMATPTFHWREGDRVYWHGSSASRALAANADAQVCLTVTLLDGFVLARSAMHHSANYRSVMLFGRAEPVLDPAAKSEKLRNFVEGLFPGRSDLLRPNTAQEEKATLVLGMDIAEGSAKIRTGMPNDDAEDYALPIWAGVVPIRLVADAPESDPRNLPDLTPPAHACDIKLGEPSR